MALDNLMNFIETSSAEDVLSLLKEYNVPVVGLEVGISKKTRDTKESDKVHKK